MEFSKFPIQIEDIHLGIFHMDNYDKDANAYYLVLPTPYIEMPPDRLPEKSVSEFLLQHANEVFNSERVVFDVRMSERFFGYEILIDPQSEIKLMPRSDYRPDNPLPFED